MSGSLILRPSGVDKYPWSLQLRFHESVGETEYHTIAHVSDHTAREIIEAGNASWLFGDPVKTWLEENKKKVQFDILTEAHRNLPAGRYEALIKELQGELIITNIRPVVKSNA